MGPRKIMANKLATSPDSQNQTLTFDFSPLLFVCTQHGVYNLLIHWKQAKAACRLQSSALQLNPRVTPG